MAKTAQRPTIDQVADELDGLLETREVERITTYSRRWISELIRAGKFPAPDAPGRIGAAHRWRRSTIRKYLADLSARA